LGRYFGRKAFRAGQGAFAGSRRKAALLGGSRSAEGKFFTAGANKEDKDSGRELYLFTVPRGGSSERRPLPKGPTGLRLGKKGAPNARKKPRSWEEGESLS